MIYDKDGIYRLHGGKIGKMKGQKVGYRNDTVLQTWLTTKPSYFWDNRVAQNTWGSREVCAPYFWRRMPPPLSVSGCLHLQRSFHLVRWQKLALTVPVLTQTTTFWTLNTKTSPVQQVVVSGSIVYRPSPLLTWGKTRLAWEFPTGISHFLFWDVNKEVE